MFPGWFQKGVFSWLVLKGKVVFFFFFPWLVSTGNVFVFSLLGFKRESISLEKVATSLC